MRVFVTGASGFIGTAVVAELLDAGHEVVGLARSDASAAALSAAGASVQRGELADLDSLRAGAAASEGVVHLAFVHDFSQFAQAAALDRGAIEAIGEVLAGSDRPFVIASGTLGVKPGEVAVEGDQPDPSSSPRVASAAAALGFASRGVRSSVVRLSPAVHDASRGGFASVLAYLARAKGVAGYAGDGSNRWNAVHRLDAARLFRLALESAPAGSVLHGVGEEGVPLRAMAEVIGRHLDVPAASIGQAELAAHFGWMAPFIGIDSPASNAHTRELLGWEPKHPSLLEDMEQDGFYAEIGAAAGE
jgi:nucleoside-diphosphate-sugar epimerase